MIYDKINKNDKINKFMIMNIIKFMNFRAVQKMAKNKDMKISEDLRQKLKIICTVKGFRSYDDLINDMLKFYCEKKGIDIKITIK